MIPSALMTALVAALTAFILLQGCGRERRITPASEQAASVSPAAAERLNLRIVLPGKDVALPDPAFDLRSPRELDPIDLRVSENRIVFHHEVDMSGPQTPFLVWSENALESPIVAASYSVRVVRSDRRLRGAADRMEASFDRTSRNWFIPFTRLLAGLQLSDVDPYDLFSVSLDLVLQDKSKTEVTAHFRLRTALPSPKITVLPGQGITNIGPATPLKGLLQSEFEAYRVIFENPTARPVVLWLRILNPTYQAVTQLTRTRYENREPYYPEGPFYDPFVSRTALVPSRLVLSGGGINWQAEPDFSQKAEGSAWVSAPFPANSVVAFSLRLTASGARCELQPDEPIVLHWAENKRGCLYEGGDGETCIRLAKDRWHQVGFTLRSELVGTRLEGSSLLEYGISEQDRDAGRRSALTRIPLALSQTAGHAINDRAAPYFCQGFF